MKIAIMCNVLTSKSFDRSELISTLREHGYDVYLGVINDGIINKYYLNIKAKLLFIDASRNNINPFIELKSILNIKKKLKKEHIETVIIYGIKNHISMVLGAKLAGVKNIMCVVNGRGNLFVFKGFKWNIVRLISYPMLKLVYSLADSICFQNNDDRIFFIEKGLVIDKNKTFTTNGSGVNLEKFSQTTLVNNNVFLFLSRITATKGIIEYIEAARIVKRKYPDAIFNVVGPIDTTVEKSNLNYIFEKAERDKVIIYHGETNNVHKWLSSSRFFIYPSYYPEGVPRSCLEALATGLPIVTFDSPGCKETVNNGINGFIIEKKDVKTLAEKMIWMIEHPEDVLNMATESRKLAENKFDIIKVNENILRNLKRNGEDID